MPDLTTLLPTVSETTIVRRFDPGDVERFHRYRSDPDLAAYQGWSPMSAQAARDFVCEMSSIAGLVRGGWTQLAIVDTADGALVGDLGLFVEADESVAELGVTLGKAAQGRGHAVRSMEQVQALVFASTTVRCIRAIADAKNLPSLRMLERAGFVRCHTYDTVFKGEACTEVLFVRWRPGDTVAVAQVVQEACNLSQNADPAATPDAVVPYS